MCVKDRVRYGPTYCGGAVSSRGTLLVMGTMPCSPVTVASSLAAFEVQGWFKIDMGVRFYGRWFWGRGGGNQGRALSRNSLLIILCSRPTQLWRDIHRSIDQYYTRPASRPAPIAISHGLFI